VLPQELDRLKAWYANAYRAGPVPPIVSLKILLDTLEKRLNT
jgi:hypothetical protein